MPQDQASPDGEQTRLVPEPLIKFVYPTNYFRYERRDNACPNLTLQQWWADMTGANNLSAPEHCKWGEWRDVPIVQEPQGPKTFTPLSQKGK